MIFLTVGTLFSFDRLVQAIDTAIGEGLIREEIFAQIGEGSYKPCHMDHAAILEKAQFDTVLAGAEGLISHAGMGSITMALEHYKPLLVMPRMRKYKEHVNDHQVATAREFERMGHVLAVYDVEELPEKIRQLKTFVPAPRVAQPEKVAERIKRFLDEIAGR